MIFMINEETVFYKVGKFVLNILKEPWHNPYQLIFTQSKSTMRDVERLSIVCVCVCVFVGWGWRGRGLSTIANHSGWPMKNKRPKIL